MCVPLYIRVFSLLREFSRAAPRKKNRDRSRTSSRAAVQERGGANCLRARARVYSNTHPERHRLTHTHTLALFLSPYFFFSVRPSSSSSSVVRVYATKSSIKSMEREKEGEREALARPLHARFRGHAPSCREAARFSCSSVLCLPLHPLSISEYQS